MLITPLPSTNFIYKSALIWNTIQPQLKIHDYSVKISIVKNKIKTLLSQNQHAHDEIEWLPDNYALNKLSSKF